MQDIYKIKTICPPFNREEKVLINYLFSEYFSYTEHKENGLNINKQKMDETKKYFYLLGMVSVNRW